RPRRYKRRRAARGLGTDAAGFESRVGGALRLRDGAGALRRGRRRDRVDLGAVRRGGPVNRSQPMESRIGQHARPDAQLSSGPAGAGGGGEGESDEGGSLATSVVEGDEESGDKSSVLLGGFRTSGRRQMKALSDRTEDATAFALSDRVALQERQRLLIELLNLLIDRRVRASFKDQQFGAANIVLHPIRKPGGGHQVVSPKCDLLRRGDPAQLRLHIVGYHGIRLLEERSHRLRRLAPNKVGQ